MSALDNGVFVLENGVCALEKGVFVLEKGVCALEKGVVWCVLQRCPFCTCVGPALESAGRSRDSAREKDAERRRRKEEGVVAAEGPAPG